MIGRILRRVSAGALRAIMLRPRMSVALGIVLVLALWSALALSAPAPSVGSPSGLPQSVSAAQSRTEMRRAGTAEAPVPSVESYLNGMTTFNARLMWDALNEDALRQMQSQGGSVEQLQQKLNETRQSGVSYDEIAYIGGYQLRDGTRYLFYVISRRGLQAPGSVEQVWFVFTVDSSGKIAKID